MANQRPTYPPVGNSFLRMSLAQRRAAERDYFKAVDELSPAGKAVFNAASDWGKSVSPEMAEALAEAALKAGPKLK